MAYFCSRYYKFQVGAEILQISGWSSRNKTKCWVTILKPQDVLKQTATLKKKELSGIGQIVSAWFFKLKNALVYSSLLIM